MPVKRIALASLFACSSTAWAQSSVTLYGVVDMALEYVNHVGDVPSVSNRFNPGPSQEVYRMNSGGLSGSRWGIRGEEALGGNLTALFVLESGFNLDTGRSAQGGRLFGRNAYVGLKSADYGQISLGRQYTSLFDAMANFVPAAFATAYEPSAILLGPNYREDNTVKYKGVFGPLSMSAHWSFGTGLTFPQSAPAASGFGGGGEIPGQFRRDTAYGVGLNYAAGPIGIGAGYDQYNPTIGTGSGTFKNAAVAVSYRIGAGKVMGGYRWGQNKNQNDVVIKRDDFYFIGGTYQVTPAFSVTAEYDYQNVKSAFGNTSLANPWQINVIGTYTLSKRTDVYLTTAFSKNAGLTLDSVANLFASSLSLGNSYTLAAGQSTMFGAAMGIRHRF